MNIQEKLRSKLKHMKPQRQCSCSNAGIVHRVRWVGAGVQRAFPVCSSCNKEYLISVYRPAYYDDSMPGAR
jgi:transposase-like protein